jgi:hypothetical protein
MRPAHIHAHRPLRPCAFAIKHDRRNAARPQHGTYPPHKLILGESRGADRGDTNVTVFKKERKCLEDLGAPKAAAHRWLSQEATTMRAALAEQPDGCLVK